MESFFSKLRLAALYLLQPAVSSWHPAAIKGEVAPVDATDGVNLSSDRHLSRR